MVSIHSEGTFGRLRYPFGGDRPSQTAHLTLSIHRFHGAMLEFQQQKSGMVSQRRLHENRSPRFHASHLSCASVTEIQYQATVKLYGVFPSSRG